MTVAQKKTKRLTGLKANKISLNVKKTQLIIFKHKNKKLEYLIKIKFSRKRLYPSKSVKYLGVKINENLIWEDELYDIVTKLNRANPLYINFNTLKEIYISIFDSHITYTNLIWEAKPELAL